MQPGSPCPHFPEKYTEREYTAGTAGIADPLLREKRLCPPKRFLAESGFPENAISLALT